MQDSDPVCEHPCTEQGCDAGAQWREHSTWSQRTGLGVPALQIQPLELGLVTDFFRSYFHEKPFGIYFYIFLVVNLHVGRLRIESVSFVIFFFKLY